MSEAVDVGGDLVTSTAAGISKVCTRPISLRSSTVSSGGCEACGCEPTCGGVSPCRLYVEQLRVVVALAEEVRLSAPDASA